MSLLNTIRVALGGVTANKLQAALTMLGIIIGVASVIAMLALGAGARAAVDASFSFLGADTVQIGTHQVLKQGQFVPANKITSYEDGLLLPRAVDLVDRMDMEVSTSGRVRNGASSVDSPVAGTTADVLNTMAAQDTVQPVNWPQGKRLSANAFLERGRTFTPDEVLAGATVCVLGHKTALDLFQGDNPIGVVVWVDRQRCEVIGVLTELETTDPSQRYRGSDPDKIAYLPISTAIHSLYASTKEPQVMITAYVKDVSLMDAAEAAIAAFMRKQHGITPTIDSHGQPQYADDFDLTTRQDILGAREAAANTFSLLLAAMAVVSLIVGGIGIMNVMLVSVMERTREIGVRMAVGARPQDVVMQFLLEAVLISAAGGLFGIAAGVLAIPLAATLNAGQAVLAPESIPLAFGVALLVGVVFGLYPAVRASRLDPVEALRYE